MKKIALLLLVVTLFSCKQIIREVVESGSNATVEKLESTDFSEVELDQLFKLSLPNYMKSMTNLNDDASLQYANIYKEAYTIVIYEDKQEFIDSFIEYGEYNVEISFIENYSGVQTNFISENLSNQQIIPYNLSQVDGLDAKQIMMKGNMDGEDIGYIIGYVKGKDNIYMIMTWTLLEKLNKYEQTFKDIIGSFKLVN